MPKKKKKRKLKKRIKRKSVKKKRKLRKKKQKLFKRIRLRRRKLKKKNFSKRPSNINFARKLVRVVFNINIRVPKLNLDKNINVIVPKDFVVPRETVLKNLEKYKNEDFILWINHASFIMKLGSTTIVSDLITAPNAGPLFLGPKRYTPPALELKQLPKIDLWLNTHLHYDHLSISDIRNFPYKSAKVIVPLNNGIYFKKNNFKDVKELDWFETIKINSDLYITLTPSQHWNKRSALPFGPGATDKALWGSFLINYKGKKIFFSCDTGYSNIYKMMGEKFGGIDIFLINVGAYNFEAITGKKDFSIFHTNPEEALQVARDIKAKKIIPMHYGSFLLGLKAKSEGPINEPRNRLLTTKKFGYTTGYKNF